MVGQNNKAAIIFETKWTLIGHNICFLMSFCSRVQNRPREKWKKKRGGGSAHLKCSEPFLETRGWLDWGDAPSLLPLTIGCSDVAKCGGCGWTWDDSCRAAIKQEGKKKEMLRNEEIKLDFHRQTAIAAHIRERTWTSNRNITGTYDGEQQ